MTKSLAGLTGVGPGDFWYDTAKDITDCVLAEAMTEVADIEAALMRLEESEAERFRTALRNVLISKLREHFE
jgi:hypothetical protein